LVVGFIDRDSPLGREYQARKAQSVFYRQARFYSVAEVVDLMDSTGFQDLAWVQTLFQDAATLRTPDPVCPGHGQGSFVVVRGTQTRMVQKLLEEWKWETTRSRPKQRPTRNQIRRRVMNEKPVSFASMRADHRQWDYVHSTWRVDLERWQHEHESALSELTKLQEMIHQHGEALEAHAKAIEQHQEDLSNHERTMSEYEHQGTDEHLQETMASAHQELTLRHQTQRDAHQRIAKHHRVVMDRLANVKAALEAAM
jgi:hypothetical protein